MSYSHEQREALIRVARHALDHHLTTGKSPRLDVSAFDEALQQLRATFVTLKHQGELRGCIGRLEAKLPLVQDVADHACDAAFCDPRFEPLTEAERPGLSIHISILSEPQPMLFGDEQDLLSQIQPGIDGLILEEPAHRCRGTFLPAVWESLPDPRHFLSNLKRKANLPDDYWSQTLRVWRYTTESIS